MNAKDLRTEAALGDRSNDGNTKYAQGGGALPCHRNKTYQDIGSSALAKADATPARPCAVIGPDRVVPPPAPPTAPADYHKKGPHEPWLTQDNVYRRPPDYPHKLLDYQHPSRNISPRQTFQENMQRIMVPPSYNAMKLKEDHNFPGDPNITQMRNIKLNVPTDSNTKYCDVPYNVNPITNDQKNVRNSDVSVSNMNTVLARGAPHGWPPTSSNIQPPKPFHQDLCQYPEYQQNCAAPRPMVMTRPHRAVHEEPGPVYPDAYYQHGNIRFKPYPSVKERYPQTRYEYIANYSNPFHPPPFATHKYDIQKPLPQSYPNYPPVPLKYLDSRMGDPIMNGYQRSLNQQPYNNVPYRNQVVHPAYGPVPGNCIPSGKYYYPPDAAKSMATNKLPYDVNGKLYPDYESNRNKNYPTSDAFYVNDVSRSHPPKGPVLPPNYPSNIHAIPAHSAHPYYRKEPLKGYEYSPHFRNMDHILGVNGNMMTRFPSQFSPSAIAISPSDSNTSNDTNQTHGTCQEDCGYVSQSSTASVRSMDSVINRMPPDMYRRYDYRYGNIIKGSTAFTKHEQNANGTDKKDKKDIDVRQFLQMWNEGEDEGGENSSKEVNINKNVPHTGNSISATNYEAANQEQLYVLGLVNVPSEELGKYEHIQKVSKLPENIKGYNSIELLHQFEEVIESSNLNHYNTKSPTSRQFHNQLKSTMPMHGIGISSRPLSPLDVEAKISQSVIHKEVGCNFEIKPCSPKMLNVEVASPVQTVIGERIIEKVSNPIMNQPQMLPTPNENRDDCNVVNSHHPIHDKTKIASCKMVQKPYGNKDPVDPVKTNYSIQDLESNSGVCLASLPRLDNDIELNFPEVNQQFINANKVESVITLAPIKDLPPLDIDQTQIGNCEIETDNSNPAEERHTDTDFTKLSKYRKLKRKSSGPNTPEANVQALRTDSVIIKNPDNCKHENLERILSPKTVSNQTQEDPINLSVNTEDRLNTDTISFESNKTDVIRGSDIAIDFSINSNETSSGSYIKVPEVISANNNDVLHNSFVKSQETYKESEHHAAVTNNLPEQKLTKCLEINCNLNIQAVCKKESVVTSNTANNIVKSSTSKLPEPLQCKSEAFLNHVEEFETTRKETLSKKQSSYDLLSSQEKEDSLNEKMRELFGEEFSTVEVEPDYEQLHDTRAILDDNSVDNIEKDYVFSHGSSEPHDKHIFVLQKDLENDIQDSCVRNKETKRKKKQKWDVVSKDALLSQSFYEKNDLENREIESFSNVGVTTPDEDKMDEQLIFSDLNSCLIPLKDEEPTKRPKTDFHRVSKELLSPWFQKLIVYTEGSCIVATTNFLANENYDKYKNENFDSKQLETKQEDNDCIVADHACAGVIKTINESSKDKNVRSPETNITTCKNIDDNEKSEIVSNVLTTINDCENKEDLGKEGNEKIFENLENKNKNTRCYLSKHEKFQVLETFDEYKTANREENDKIYLTTEHCDVSNKIEANDEHQVPTILDNGILNKEGIKTNDHDHGSKIETIDNGDDEVTISLDDGKLNKEFMEGNKIETIDNHEISISLNKLNKHVMEANDHDNGSSIETIENLDISISLDNDKLNKEVMEINDHDNGSKLETIDSHKIPTSLDSDKLNNEVMDADDLDNCSENNKIDEYEISSNLGNDKLNKDVIIADDYNSSSNNRMIDEHQIASRLDNDKPNKEVMKADAADNCNSKIEVIDKHQITSSLDNDNLNKEVMTDDSECSSKIEAIDVHKIVTSLENEKIHKRVTKTDDIGTARSSEIETIQENETATNQGKDKLNTATLKADDCGNCHKTETNDHKIADNMDTEKLHNVMEADISNNGCKNCSNIVEANTKTVDANHYLKDNPKLENAININEWQANEHCSITNLNNDTENLENTLDEKVCGGTKSYNVSAISSSNRTPEQIVSNIDKTVDVAATHESKEYLVTDNLLAGSSTTDTDGNKSTNILRNDASKIEKNNKTTYDREKFKLLNSNNKCSDYIENAFSCSNRKLNAQGDIYDETLDIDTANKQIDMKVIDPENEEKEVNLQEDKAIAFPDKIFDVNEEKEVNLQEDKAIAFPDKIFDVLNYQANFSRWSLNQTLEHTGILSPLTPDTETDLSESETTCDGNESETGLIRVEDNANCITPISKDDNFHTNQDKQQSVYESKISGIMKTTNEANSNVELIPIMVKDSISEQNLENSMQEQPSNAEVKTFEPVVNDVACSFNSKSNKTTDTYFENNSSNSAQSSSSQTISEKNVKNNYKEGAKPNMCERIHTETIIEESTSCSDVHDESSASDDDDGDTSSESEDSIVSQNDDNSDKRFIDMTVHKVIENNKLVSVDSKDVFCNKRTNSNLRHANKDSLHQYNETHDTEEDKKSKTSEEHIVNTQSLNYDSTNVEQNYATDDFISEPVLCEPNFSRENSVENIGNLKDCVEVQVDAQNEVIDDIIEDSQYAETNFVHVSQNVMDDSGIMLEASQEHRNFEILEETNPIDTPPHDISKKIRYPTNYLAKRRKSLKRSLSDSALDEIRENFNEGLSENDAPSYPNKRKKVDELNNYNTSRFIAENICQVFQSNRRNSISSAHNEGNVSFCILIDNNCIISEECDESAKICFSEVPEDCLASIEEETFNEEDCIDEVSLLQNDNNCEYSIPVQTNAFEDDLSNDEPWVDDVACVETVVSEDIAEDVVISASTSPKDDEYNDEETDMYDLNEHTDKLNYIYGDKIYNDDTHFVQTLYRTPQMNVNETLNRRESITDDSHIDDGSRYYDKESLEKVLSESNVQVDSDTKFIASLHRTPLPSPIINETTTNASEQLQIENCPIFKSSSPPFQLEDQGIDSHSHDENHKEYTDKETKESIINSCESTIDDVFKYKNCEGSPNCTTSSSPEVSSTTSEEKGSGILLKITNYGGSRVSQVNDISPLNRISCKYTEKKDYLSSNGNLPTRTLITKGAQKYIPPLKETIRDLKVKLPLPQQSLLRLKQLKVTKEALKLNGDKQSNNLRKDVPKKAKPKFEDVLKSIDEMQFQKQREKNKKGRKSIPKVVIKKNEHGSHYASTSSNNRSNPDLTGMKWQPWVFLEKDNFIDKMALRKKTRAIFSYRKNTYVLAEKFQKYKSICNTKFVISQPKHNDSTSGQLKYTIRLKHNY